ncbi:unnamed protein product [Lepidochelys kempii]
MRSVTLVPPSCRIPWEKGNCGPDQTRVQLRRPGSQQCLKPLGLQGPPRDTHQMVCPGAGQAPTQVWQREGAMQLQGQVPGPSLSSPREQHSAPGSVPWRRRCLHLCYDQCPLEPETQVRDVTR